MNSAAARIAAVVRSGLVSLTVFTFVVDILLLIQPIYMLQVYDRVLASGSIETLVFISIMAAGALALLALIDTFRSIMAGRIAARMDKEAGADVLLASLNEPRAPLGDVQPLRDLAVVRGFISNRAILAYLDLPFAPLFIGLLYLIHPDLFWITVGGAVVLTLLAFVNQLAGSRASAEAGDHSMRAMISAQSFARSSESIRAMGMAGNVIRTWGRDEAASLMAQDRAIRANAILAAVSRSVRLGLQIALLGYGGYLVVKGQMTAGMIFASSLIAGRGLQPIDQIVAGWKGFVDTRRAWKRLSAALQRQPADRASTELPTPKGHVHLDDIVVYPPNATSGEPLLKRITARIEAGDCVAIVGPSGAGKSTLSRAIVGALQVRSGAVRIDGADIRQWDAEKLGRHIGYLAQDVDLLPGSVAQNIARFDAEARDVDIVEAAERAQVHDLILGLKDGYDTIIGPAGQQLSGGQRQRVGLARAFYGQPTILVLDEPNANLDPEGDQALERALERAKEKQVTVLIVTQRRQIADKADKILILRNGALDDFGTRVEVLERQAQKARSAQDTAGSRPASAPAQRFTTVAGGAKTPAG